MRRSDLATIGQPNPTVLDYQGFESIVCSFISSESDVLLDAGERKFRWEAEDFEDLEVRQKIPIEV
jgi:hypothetical protein